MTEIQQPQKKAPLAPPMAKPAQAPAPATMSTAVLIIGESGTGKSSSLRNLDPEQTILIQIVAKPLPFKAKGWARRSAEKPAGNVFHTDNAAEIVRLMKGTSKTIVVIDDFQYLMSNEYVRRTTEKGYDKFTDIAKNAHTVMTAATALRPDQRCYILAHSSSDEGRTRIKTVGKMTDSLITPEGLFSIVLRTAIQDGKYYFATQNNGQDTTKSPIGMFSTPLIDNDLAAVDKSIVEYYADSI